MSGPYRATRPLLRLPRTHRLRCARGRTRPVRVRHRRARSHCGASAALTHPQRRPFAGNRRPARRCRTALRSRSAPSCLQSPRAAHAAHARAAACAPVCTPCPPCARACEGAIRGRSGVELCLGWPPPIRYFERSRSDAVGSSQHSRFPPRPRQCDTPARAARQRGRGTRTAAPRVVSCVRGRDARAPHRIGTSLFDPPSPTGARPPCPHFAISATPGRPSRAQP